MASPTFQVEDNYNRTEAGPKKRGPWFGCLIGCLVVLGLGVLVAVLGGVWIANNWKGMAAGGMAMGIKAEVDASELAPDEKAQVKVEIDRFADSMSDDQTSAEEVAQFMQVFAQEFMESPLMGTIMLSAAEQEQIDKSGLTDEEKAEARVALQRLLRGMLDRDIAQGDADAAAGHIAIRQPNNRWRLKQTVSDEELRAFTTDAKKAADDANVPEQPGPFDPSDEVKKVVDSALSWNAPNDPAAMPNDPTVVPDDPAVVPNSEDPTTDQ